MKKLLLSLSFSIAFALMMLSPVSATDAMLNSGQTLNDNVLIDIVDELNGFTPNFDDDYYYIVMYATTNLYYVYIFPKNNTFGYLLANNYTDADLYTIDKWWLYFDDNILPMKRYSYIISTKTLEYYNSLTSYDVEVTNKVLYTNLPTYVRYSYFDGSTSTQLYPIDPIIFGYTSIPSNILKGDFNEFQSGSFFDFIVSFDNWLSKSLNDLIYTDPYLVDYGSVYDYKQNGFIKFGVYLLFVIAFVVTLTFVLGFVKSAYYFVKEIF